MGDSFTVFTTQGVATVMTNLTGTTDFNGVSLGYNGEDVGLRRGEYDFTEIPGEITARFDQGSTMVYTSVDASCYTGSLSTCLSKGDLIFLFDADWPTMVDGTMVKLGSTAASNSG